MQITALCTGTILSWKHLLVHNAPTGIRFEVPVKCFYIEHGSHRLLFDAGQKPLDYPQSSDADYLVRVTAAETAAGLLRRAGIRPESIEYIVLSHLHSDHSAGVADFPQAEVLLQQRELDGSGQNTKPLSWHLLEGEYDIFGDGRLQILPSYGHTPGHQSLLITLDDSSKALLTGDAAYTSEAISYNCTAEEYLRRPEYFDTLEQLRKMQENNIKLIYSHE